MTAKEAREMAMNCNSAAAQSQLDKVMMAINQAVRDGFLSINTYQYLRPDVRKKLEDLGYSVGENTSDGRNEDNCIVSW